MSCYNLLSDGLTTNFICGKIKLYYRQQQGFIKMMLLNSKQFNSWTMDCSREQEHRVYSPAIILGSALGSIKC